MCRFGGLLACFDLSYYHCKNEVKANQNEVSVVLICVHELSLYNQSSDLIFFLSHFILNINFSRRNHPLIRFLMTGRGQKRVF